VPGSGGARVRSVLSVNPAEEADLGEYSCVVVNSLGRDEGAFVLRKKGERAERPRLGKSPIMEAIILAKLVEREDESVLFVARKALGPIKVLHPPHLSSSPVVILPPAAKVVVE